MSVWQVVLIILTSIVLGLVAGYFISLVVKRLIRRPPSVGGDEAMPVASVQRTGPPASPTVEFRPPSAGQRAAEPAKPSEPSAAVEAIPPVSRAAPAEARPGPVAILLISEVERNLRIATEPWAGKLVPFQTQVWDSNLEAAHALPETLSEDLTQAYADMRLANSIVWLSSELGRRSANLDESYIKLCVTVAERLKRVIPLLRWTSK